MCAQEFGGTAMFLLGACGETGPIEQKQADTAVTERLGRKVGYATASVLETLREPATELRYSGPIVSGAVIGKETPLLRRFFLKTIVLPRQARDKQRES